MSKKAPAKGKGKESSPGGGDENSAGNAPARSSVSVGRSLELEVVAEIAMEDVVEKLKLLKYEVEFCQLKRPFWTPLAHTYFALPSPSNNQNEQFFYFTSLVAWLLKKAGSNYKPPQQFDDPNAACTDILMELKKLGFAQPQWPPAKLKQGYGEAPVGVLFNLLDLVLAKAGITWEKPIYLPDNYEDEADIDDGDDLETAADIGEDMASYENDEEEEAYMGGIRADGAASSKKKEEEDDEEERGVLESKVDAAEWKMELERVAPQLKITMVSDTKDWRSHLDQTHLHHTSINKSLPDSKVLLEKVENEVASTLEKLHTREKYINSHCESLTTEYRMVRERLATMQERYNKSTETVAELTNELAHVSEELEGIKSKMDEKGNNIADTSPLVKIKDAIKRLRSEVTEMEVRIGVVEHTLLQKAMAGKGEEGFRLDGNESD